MQPAFAPLQQQANATVMAVLANAVAAIGGRSVPVIFEQPYAAPFDTQVDSAEPECTGASADLAGVGRGDPITIGSAAFRVERAEPDGTGLTRLVLASGG